MLPLTPAAKAGTVAAGFLVALVGAVVAVYLRQKLTEGPDSLASSGMYAGGEMLLGLGVFGLFSLLPLSVGLYWLRPVARFWTVLCLAAVLFALTGPLALVLGAGPSRTNTIWALLGLARLGLMPFGALALLACALFAPAAKPRWILLGTALVEGGVFVAVVLVKFVLAPH